MNKKQCAGGCLIIQGYDCPGYNGPEPCFYEPKLVEVDIDQLETFMMLKLAQDPSEKKAE